MDEATDLEVLEQLTQTLVESERRERERRKKISEAMKKYWGSGLRALGNEYKVKKIADTVWIVIEKEVNNDEED